MAENEELDQDQDLDLDAKPASSKKKIIIIAVAAIVLIGAAVGVTLMLLGGGDEEAAEEEVVAEEQAKPETHYMPLEKMVVNFAQKGPVRYLQVEMELMAHDPAVIDAIKEHMPAIRNDMLVLLASQKYEQLSSREGKENLRGELLVVAQKIIKENADLDGPQSVYFTNFVMQ
jgi:flagellar FliL protein